MCFHVCLFERMCEKEWLRGRVCLVLPEWVRSDKADSHRLIFLRAANFSSSHRPTERNKIYVSLCRMFWNIKKKDTEIFFDMFSTGMHKQILKQWWWCCRDLLIQWRFFIATLTVFTELIKPENEPGYTLPMQMF